MTADILFQQAVNFTLDQEGGWADNPADPGGATMCGITLAVSVHGITTLRRSRMSYARSR